MHARIKMSHVQHSFLDNGLRVLLVPTASKVSTFNVTYGIGSANEGLGVTGAAHIEEHMLFGGSKNFQGSEGMWKLEEMGAVLNATTSLDRTNFFEVVSTEHLHECIVREADRMLQPLNAASKLKSEMTVVRNERERGANNPFERMQSKMMNIAFLEHPYHHSTIGYLSDIEHITAETLQDFHSKFYTPNNATVIVAGNIADNTLDVIQTAFGDIPRGEHQQTFVTEPEQCGMRRFAESGPAGILGIGFKAPCGLHTDAIALELLAHNINSGPTSIFQPLVESGVVYNINASWGRMKDPYLFSIWASAPDPHRAEACLWKIIESQPEFDVPRAALKQQYNRSVESSQGMASELNEAVARGSWKDVWDRHQVADTCDVAQVWKYFNPQKATVGIMVPMETMAGAPHASLTSVYDQDAMPVPSGVQDLQDVQEVLHDTPGTYMLGPTDNIHLRVEYASKAAPAVNTLLANLVLKGSNGSNARQIQTQMNNQGVERQVEATSAGLVLHYNAPRSALNLVLHEITKPCLTNIEFRLAQKQHIDSIGATVHNVDKMAALLLKNTLFHDQVMPQQSRDLIQQLKEVRSTWNNINAAKVSVLAGSLEDLQQCAQLAQGIVTPKALVPKVKPTDVSCHMPKKTSCAIMLGCAVKETAALKIAASALGGGFAGRLMKIVRDKMGLTYGIYAGTRPDMFAIQTSFAPQLLEQGIQATHKVIEEWRHGITHKELETHKQMLLGQREVKFDDFDKLVEFKHNNTIPNQDIQSCSLEEVNCAIKELGTLVQVKVGSY